MNNHDNEKRTDGHSFEVQYDRDRNYWNQFYAEMEGKLDYQSSFANFALKYLEKNKHLLDLGCGNGRDSIFFHSQGIRITAVDASDYALNRLIRKYSGQPDISFICSDFVESKEVYANKYDYAYSRFTLHAINEEQETVLLRNVSKSLNPNGLLLIEARTINDDLYGLGKKVNKNAYVYNDHYRRFLDPKEFEAKLYSMGFELLYQIEDRGFSKTASSDPVLMRSISRLKT